MQVVIGSVTADQGLPANTSRHFAFGGSGSGVGVHCRKPVGTTIALTDSYRMSFDLVNSAWGDYAGLAYDSAYAIGVEVKNNSGTPLAIISFPDDSTKTLTLDNTTGYASWWRVEMQFTGSTVTARIFSFITGEWYDICTNATLATDTSGTDKMNPGLWNNVFLHAEGAQGMLDNIRLEQF
jgi:hypothetical protein